MTTASQTARAWVVGFAVVVASTGLLMFAVASIEQAKHRDQQVTDLVAQTKADRRQLEAMAARLSRATEQNAELVDLLRERGVEPPESLVTRTTTRIERRDTDNEDSDDGDDDGDTIIVRPAAPTARPTTRPPAPDDNDDRVTDLVPEVPLPDEVGKATDDVKKLADDTLDGVLNP